MGESFQIVISFYVEDEYG